jgi:hypothetical protein
LASLGLHILRQCGSPTQNLAFRVLFAQNAKVFGLGCEQDSNSHGYNSRVFFFGLKLSHLDIEIIRFFREA